MKQKTGVFLSLIVLFSFHLSAYSQGGIDKLMDILDTQAIQYENLGEEIINLEDHILTSVNDFDSKGDEINALYKDYSATMEQSAKAITDLENEMDTFEAGCGQMLEDKCPDQEKAFEKLFAQVQDIYELGREPREILDMVNNTYDEKALLKTFKSGLKACGKVQDALGDLKDDLMDVAEQCGE